MPFEYRPPSRSSRGSGFRSPRRGRGSFRGRGRGSDSYFSSSGRGSYSDKPSFRGSSYRGSSFRDRDDYYDSRNSGSKYSHERYSGSRGRKDEDSYHHREMRESSGFFGRDHSRRNDGEPERKKLRSEIGSYKEGASSRRSYDDMEHSGRGFNSNSSPYHSDSSPFGKSHKKDYSEFKKPMPLDHDFSSRRAVRGSRGRGNFTKTVTRTIKSTTAPALLKRGGVSRISRLSTAARLQQLLRRKKQLRIMRMRREREERLRVSGTKHEDENNVASSEEELEGDEELDNEPQVEEEDEDVKPDLKVLDEDKTESSKKGVKKVIKKEPAISPEKNNASNESSEPKEKKKYAPVKGLRRDHIALKCAQCKTEFETFKVYHMHLSSYKHKSAMEKLLYSMKQKLSRMRTEQREQQRIIDEQSDDFAKTSYCKLCKLNYKQTKQEHCTSDFHINMQEFLNPRCSVCRISFGTPILYEHHRCTLQHIKRKAFLEKKKELSLKDADLEDENNEEDSFMVLDSVGSADESNDESEKPAGSGDAANTTGSSETKKKAPKVIGSEFIKKVSCYYCKLCRMCLTYNPNRNQEELLLSHCRGRFHLKRFSLEKLKSKTKQTTEAKPENQTENTSANEPGEEGADEKLWAGEDVVDDEHKMSEDEEDSQSGSSNRYDRFGHSDEKETIEKLKTSVEVGAGDAGSGDQENAATVVKKEAE